MDMETSESTTLTTLNTSRRSISPTSSSSPTTPPPSAAVVSPSSPPTPPPTTSVVVSPCAACKILRRRCAEKCVLAPYFPPNDPLKFTTAHRVFGASNIIKFLQELPETQRADAVSSMVYEANARLRDPVYGCAGAICQLQKQVSELQAQLAKAQAELVNMQFQHANLKTLVYMEMAQFPQGSSVSAHDQDSSGFGEYLNMNSPRGLQNNLSFLDDTANYNLGSWTPDQLLWT